MATTLQEVTNFLATYSGDVSQIPPDQFIPFIQILADALVDTISAEHTTGGVHQFASGNIADRPLAADATWYLSTDESSPLGPRIYFSDGVSWYNMTEIDATKLPYANTSHATLTKVSLALNYVLAVMNTFGELLGSKVKTTLTGPNVLAPDGLLDSQLATIDDKLSSFDPTKIQVAWGGTSKHLQQAITDTKAILDGVAAVSGAGAIGFDPTAGSFRHIQSTDLSVWSAIKRLDEKLYKEGTDTTSSAFTHTPQGTKFFGSAVAITMQALLNTIENAMTRMPIAHVISGTWLDELDTGNVGIANKELMEVFQFPEDPSTAGLGTLGIDNVYIDQFACRVMDKDSVDVASYIVFYKNDAGSPVTLTVPTGATMTATNRVDNFVFDTDLDYMTIYGYLDSAWTTGEPVNWGWSARMAIHRNVGDLVA